MPPGAAGAGAGLIAAILVAMVLNNIDRQLLALIKPLLDREFGWSALSYGRVTAAGQLAAALCLPVMGWLVDLVSTRRCLGWGVALWSGFTAAQGLATGAGSMLGVRVGLTGAEAIATPAALKVLGALVPPRRRALALGLFNMAPSVGAMIGPLLVPLLAWSLGWRCAAAIIGALGFAWLVWWRWVSRDAPLVSAAPPASPSDASPLRRPAVWLLIAAKALTDQLWWVFLYWLPAFFIAGGGGAVMDWAGKVTGIYIWAALGSLTGAFAVVRWQHAHVPGAQRWIASCCLGVAALLLVATMPNAAISVAACALAIFGHQIVSVLVFSAISDDRFQARVGTITGVAAFAGNLLAVGSIALVSRSIAAGLGYAPALIGLAIAYVAGGACLLGARQLNQNVGSIAT